MEVVNEFYLTDFVKSYSDSRTMLSRWKTLMEAGDFANFLELKKTFGDADYVEGKTVFDIRGNKYRLIVKMAYTLKTATVLGVLTHAEYDKGDWKKW